MTLIERSPRTGPDPTPAAWTWTWPALISLLLLTMLATILQYPAEINHDVAMYLQCGQLLLEGQRPYVDFIDLNPPMVMYLSVIPVAVASLVSQPAGLVASVMVLGLVVISAVLVYRLLPKADPAMEGSSRGFATLAWVAVHWVVMVTVDFGQREQLFILFIVPWLLARQARWNGGTLHPKRALLLGMAAGLFSCFKPHLLLIPAVLELYWLARIRRKSLLLSPETWGYITAPVAYMCHFLLWPSSMTEAFFGRWMPLVWKHYQVFQDPLLSVPRLSAVFYGLAVTLAVMLVARDSRRRLTPPLLLTLSGLAVYFIQQKGFSYQLIPALGGTALEVGTLVAWARDLIPPEGAGFTRRDLARVPGAGAAFVGLTVLMHVRNTDLLNELQPLLLPDHALQAQIERLSAPGDPVMVLSTSVHPTFAALFLSNRKPGSRYLWLFPLPMFYEGVLGQPRIPYRYHTRETASPLELRMLEDLSEDVATRNPKLILINAERCQGASQWFHMGEYLRVAGFFERSMGNYRPVAIQLPMEIWQRKN